MGRISFECGWYYASKMTYEETTHCHQKRDLLRLSHRGRPPTATRICSQRPNSVFFVDFKSWDIVRVRVHIYIYIHIHTYQYHIYFINMHISCICIHPAELYEQNLQTSPSPYFTLVLLILDATEIAGWFIPWSTAIWGTAPSVISTDGWRLPYVPTGSLITLAVSIAPRYCKVL